MKFEDFLREKHAKEYEGTDDDMIEAFDFWLEDSDADWLIVQAEEWHTSQMKDVLERVKKKQSLILNDWALRDFIDAELESIKVEK